MFERMNLAKYAALCAVIFGVAFGLCSVTVATDGMGSERLASVLVPISLATEAVCLLALLVIGSLALVRAATRTSTRGD